APPSHCQRHSASSRAGLQFLANDTAQRLLQLWRLSIEVRPKRGIDEGLIAGCSPGLFRHFKKAVHNVLVEPDGNPGLALRLGFRRKNPAPFTLGEVVAIFHGCASYLSPLVTHNLSVRTLRTYVKTVVQGNGAE